MVRENLEGLPEIHQLLVYELLQYIILITILSRGGEERNFGFWIFDCFAGLCCACYPT